MSNNDLEKVMMYGGTVDPKDEKFLEMCRSGKLGTAAFNWVWKEDTKYLDKIIDELSELNKDYEGYATFVLAVKKEKD